MTDMDRAPVIQADREAVAEYVSVAFGEEYRNRVLHNGRWPDLVQAFANYRSAFAAERPGVGELDKRAAVNRILGELLAPLVPDVVERIRVGGHACSLILAALSPAPVKQSLTTEEGDQNRLYNAANAALRFAASRNAISADDERAILDRLSAPPIPATVDEKTPELVETIREWLMSTDHEVSDWERQFAAAIKAMMLASGWSLPAALSPTPVTGGGE